MLRAMFPYHRWAWLHQYQNHSLPQHFFLCPGINRKLSVTFNGFQTSMYRRKGCASSTCEGVEKLKELSVSILIYSVLIMQSTLLNTVLAVHLQCQTVIVFTVHLQCKTPTIHIMLERCILTIFSPCSICGWFTLGTLGEIDCFAVFQDRGEMGCVLLGPTCTYATFQMVE